MSYQTRLALTYLYLKKIIIAKVMALKKLYIDKNLIFQLTFSKVSN